MFFIYSKICFSPKPLELTAANESLLIDNEDLFRKNGFSFKIDPNGKYLPNCRLHHPIKNKKTIIAPATKKVSLTAIPVSKNYKFGKDDIDEMLFMLKVCTCITIASGLKTFQCY